MAKRAEFKTGTTAVEFTDSNKVANLDYTVLPQMVNANITNKDKEENQLTSPPTKKR